MVEAAQDLRLPVEGRGCLLALFQVCVSIPDFLDGSLFIRQSHVAGKIHGSHASASYYGSDLISIGNCGIR